MRFGRCSTSINRGRRRRIRRWRQRRRSRRRCRRRLERNRMTIKCDEYNGICVLSIDGDFSGEAGAAVRRCAQEQMEQRQAAEFIVDLEKSGFVDSSALETLLWLKRRCEELLGRVKIAAADENCRKI